MMIIGGLDTESETIFNDIYLFNINNNQWRKLDKKSGTQISSRENQSCTLINDCLYVFGGQGNTVDDQDIFYNDIFKIRIDLTNKTQTVYVTEINPISGNLPLPRASHSAVAYCNRFLIVTGGEGLPNQQIEQHHLVKQTLIDMEETVEQSSRLLYPKNDVWVYDILLNFWTEITPQYAHTTIIFKPRFTHSCVCYKNYLFIFGGMMNTKQSLDDLSILDLQDEANQNDQTSIMNVQDQCKICPTCHMIFSLSNWLNYNPQKKSIEELKDLFTQKNQVDSTCQQNHEESNDNMVKFIQPRISTQFISSISQQILHPFQAIALILDNSYLFNVETLQISLLRVYKKNEQFNNQSSHKGDILNQGIDDELLENSQLFFLFHEEIKGFDLNDFFQIVYKFDVPNQTIYYRKVEDSVELQDQAKNKLSQYANNLKLGGLRLGNTILFISRRIETGIDIINVAYISSNKLDNPQPHHFASSLFSYNNLTEQFITENGNLHLKNIMTNVQQFMTKEQLLKKQQKGNSIYIFDLRKMQKKSDKNPNSLLLDYEYTYNTELIDLYIRKKGISQFAGKNKIQKLVDYSFKNFIKYLYLQPTVQVVFNGGVVDSRNYQDVLLELQNNNYIEFNTLQNYFKDLNECGENVKIFSVCQSGIDQDLQGILVYYEGRLISRAETEKFGPYMIQKIIRKYLRQPQFFQYVGIVELSKFIQPNLFKNGIQNFHYSNVLYETFKNFIRQSKAIERVNIAKKLALVQINQEQNLMVKQKEEQINQITIQHQQEIEKKNKEIQKYQKDIFKLNTDIENLTRSLNLAKSSESDNKTQNDLQQMRTQIEEILSDSSYKSQQENMYQSGQIKEDFIEDLKENDSAKKEKTDSENNQENFSEENLNAKRKSQSQLDEEPEPSKKIFNSQIQEIQEVKIEQEVDEKIEQISAVEQVVPEQNNQQNAINE